MDDGALGKRYGPGEVICRQGEPGDRMYVMQEGRAIVSRQDAGHEVVLGELGPGDLFGEMAIFDREPRSATVRAKGSARVLTLDKRGFLKRVHEDPSLAYRILRDLSRRVRTLNRELAQSGRAETLDRRYLLIVAADRPELFQHLAEDFAEDHAVEVIVDRRARGPRAPGGESQAYEDPEKDRRQRKRDALLHAHGMIIVRAQGPR